MRHRIPAPPARVNLDVAIRRVERATDLQLGATDMDTVLSLRPLPPVPAVVAR